MLVDSSRCSANITKEIDCPFCHYKITALYKPPMLQFHVSRISAKTARVPYRTKEKYEILIDRCPSCGKSKKEIQKMLEKGKEPSNEEVIRRLKEAGLDPSRLK